MSSKGIRNITETLDDFLDQFLEWLLAALHPVEKCRDLLLIPEECRRMRVTLRLWRTAFIISVVIDIPIYRLYGIEWSTLGFHLSSFACLTFAIVACGFAFQISLRLYGIKSTFADITAIYTAYVMCYQPLITLISCFGELRFFAIASATKSQGLRPDQATSYFLTQAMIAGKALNFLNFSTTVCEWFSFAFLCAASTLMATSIAARYSVPKLKSISALSFATAVLVLPIILLQGIVTAYTIYSFISLASPSVAVH